MPHTFERDGYEVVEGVMSADACDALAAALRLPDGKAGSRDLLQLGAFRDAARRLGAAVALQHLIPPGYVAVQCTLFAKDAGRNWLVAPHQDLSIPVQGRIDSPHYRGWSFKQGTWFVQPPVAVLEKLVAIRLQLDPDSEKTGPLQVVPGSHRDGRLDSDPGLRGNRAIHPCVVGKGGVVAMRPLLTHASTKARAALPRRVLHFLFGPPILPGGARWKQVA